MIKTSFARPFHPHRRPCPLLLLLVLCHLGSLWGVAAPSSSSLAGPWRLELDREDVGVSERWFERRLPAQVELPGSLPAQGIGDRVTVQTAWTGGIVDRSFYTAPEYAKYREPGNIKVPFWLQPERYFVAPAWYQRDISIPQAWAGHRIVVWLERPHWETQVWLDGQRRGTNQSLSTPHQYELGLLPPGPYTLTVRVDNRVIIDVGRDSHSISDHTQGNWNGIVGAIELRATPPVWIDDLQIHPNLSRQIVRVQGRLGNVTGLAGHGQLTLRIHEQPPARRPASAETRLEIHWTADGGAFEHELALPQAKPWDEFEPNLYAAEAVLEVEPAWRDVHTASFGFREFGTRGTEFTINGRKAFLRGTLECAIFPRTGHPPVDVTSWRRVIQAAKAHGLNNLRFHSWCPPEAAFQAADELGFYLHVECGSWANASTTLGDGKPVDAWVYQEANRILRFYGNHPSFVILLYGNEPGGDRHRAFLQEWVTHYRQADPRRLYSSGAGWPELPENQFHVIPEPRIQAWGAGLKSRINAHPPETRADYRESISSRAVPVISHEIGQWCVYPNFAEMTKYTGYLKPRNFEIFRERLASHRMLDLARDFLLASGKLQTLCYKEEIESALRTPGLGGFQLLDLHDFPGQGTALVGVLDPFWEPKGYVTAEQFRRFCDATVPLARMDRRIFTQAEEAVFQLEVTHFGSKPLTRVWPVAKLVNQDGTVVLQRHWEARTVQNGSAQPVADLNLPFRDLPAPAQYKLVFALAHASDGTNPICENDWDLWVYGAENVVQPGPGIEVVRDLESARARLQSGARVLWLIPPERVAPDQKLGPVALGFSSIFWNTAWTSRQAPHTLGILCDPKHPLLAAFPTEYHSNWQWWYLIRRAGAMILDQFPADLRPAVQVIDDWFTARKLGLVFEARVGPGKLVVCSIDLETSLEEDPVARQFRKSVLQYMASDRFEPSIRVEAAELGSLTATPRGEGP